MSEWAGLSGKISHMWVKSGLVSARGKTTNKLGKLLKTPARLRWGENIKDECERENDLPANIMMAIYKMQMMTRLASSVSEVWTAVIWAELPITSYQGSACTPRIRLHRAMHFLQFTNTNINANTNTDTNTNTNTNTMHALHKENSGRNLVQDGRRAE